MRFMTPSVCRARRSRLIAALIGLGVAASPLPAERGVFAQSSAQSDLRIVVISGEDAVNIIQQKTAVTPIVEVRDRNNLPVAGAVVTFTIEGGKGAAFGGASTLTVTTNAAGQAAAAGFSPAAAGAVQINVQAAFQGQVAAATIAQTNVMTAAEAAAAAGGTGGGAGSGTSTGAAGGGGSGGLSATTIGVIAGAAGAGVLVATQVGSSNSAPVAGSVTASPAIALMASDNVSFSAQASDPDNDPLTYRWDFGDGTTSAEPSPRHIYSSAGTFNVQVTVSDGKESATGTGTVTVRSLTGTWRSDTIQSNFGPVNVTLALTQNGTTLTGTNPVIVGPTGSGGPGALTGTVRTESPRVNMSWVLSNDGVAGRTGNYQMNLDPSPDLNTLSGFVGGPTGVFRRQ